MENDIDQRLKEELEDLDKKYLEASDDYLEVENEERRLAGLMIILNQDVEENEKKKLKLEMDLHRIREDRKKIEFQITEKLRS